MKERFFARVKKASNAVRLSLAGLVLLGCAEGAQQEVSPTQITPTPVTREFTPVPFRDFPSPTATESPRPDSTRIAQPTGTVEARPTVTVPAVTPPVSGAPRPGENRAMRLDGRNDGLKVESSGISLSGLFRVEAKIKLEGNPGGDTIVSKGDGLAIFARSLRCLDKLGLLLDGQDVCTNSKLGLNIFNEIVVAYDGNEVVVVVNGQEVLRRSWQGPLQISSADLMIGRRPGASRQPLTGLVDDLKIYDDGKLAYSSNFNQGFSDQSPQQRAVEILGDPKLEVVR